MSEPPDTTGSAGAPSRDGDTPGITLELESAPAGYSAPPMDLRPPMPEPPPVRLLAVEDLLVDAPAGVEPELDDFYVEMLQFDREDPTPPHGRSTGSGSTNLASSGQASSRRDRHAPQEAAGQIVYKAENVHLRVIVREPPITRPDMRPITIAVRSLADAEAKIIARELEYERLRGLLAGQETLMLRDPAGNWVAIVESREMR